MVMATLHAAERRKKQQKLPYSKPWGRHSSFLCLVFIMFYFIVIVIYYASHDYIAERYLQIQENTRSQGCDESEVHSVLFKIGRASCRERV